MYTVGRCMFNPVGNATKTYSIQRLKLKYVKQVCFELNFRPHSTALGLMDTG
jgi:hypothetical protein